MVKLEKQNFQYNRKKYIKIEKELREKLSKNITIEHVGSTAIPNMYGKNIIDVLIGASNDKQFKEIEKILKEMKYISSSNSQTPIYLFFASKEEETKSGDIHIHLVMKNTVRFNEFLILKEYLLNNPDEAKEYSNFKLDIIKKGNNERKDYKKIKSEYVTSLLERAKKAHNNL